MSALKKHIIYSAWDHEGNFPKITISQSKFTKLLRQNSSKFYNDVLKTADNKCEICGWGTDSKNCLHIHHINPINNYSFLFYAKKELPDDHYEMSNLIALCPNCHTVVHKLASLSLRDIETIDSFRTWMAKNYNPEESTKINEIASQNIFYLRHRGYGLR